MTDLTAAAEICTFDIVRERLRQLDKWGPQEHPDGTGEHLAQFADKMRAAADRAAAEGKITWRDILAEETFEAFAESDPARLRSELVQVAAVAVAWIEDIDNREFARVRAAFKAPVLEGAAANG